MASARKEINFDLAATSSAQIQFAGLGIDRANSEGIINIGYSMQTSFSFDFNITSADAEGILEIFLQNDTYTASPYITDPVISFSVATGTFAGGQTKQTIDSNGVVFTAYMGIKYTATSGTGTIQMIGNITNG